MFDSESGLYYLRPRYYDPLTAQFLSRDPLVTMTRSAYAYVSGSPTNASDPSGLWGLSCDWCGQVAQHAEQTFHENAKAIATVAHGVAAACGLASLLVVADAITGPCALAASGVAALADASMAAHHDSGASWTNVAIDVVSLGAGGAAFKAGQDVKALGPAWSAALRAGQDASALRQQLMAAKSLQTGLQSFLFLGATVDSVTFVKGVSAAGASVACAS